MKKHFLFIVLAAAALCLATTACVEMTGKADDADRFEIRFEPQTDAVTKAPLSSFPNNRSMQVVARYYPDGTIATGSDVNYFPATTYTYSTSNGYASSSGNYVRYWPLDNTGYLNFLAYSTDLSVSSVTWNANYSLGVSFVTPDNSSTQDDILVGSKYQATRTASGGNQITFKHAQALITFTALSTVAYNSTTNAGITITDIQMSAAAHQGTCSVSRNWNSGSGDVSVSWSTSTSNNKNGVRVPGSNTARNLTTSAQSLGTGIMMPKQTNGGQYVIIYYTLHNGAGNDIAMNYKYNLDGTTWNPGYNYTYQFTFNQNVITVTTAITDWANGGTTASNL